MTVLLVIVGFVAVLAQLVAIRRVLDRLVPAASREEPLSEAHSQASAPTGVECPHPPQQRVDASTLRRKQFLCLACRATVASEGVGDADLR